MSGVEDAVRDAMRRADDLAPTTAEFRFRPPGQAQATRRWIAAVAAAACVVAVAVTVVSVTSRHRHHDAVVTPTPTPTPVAALECPATAPGAPRPAPGFPLPARRADTLVVTDRLVPLTVPSRAIVCAYVQSRTSTLAGSRVIDTGLSHIPDTLGWLPPLGRPLACALSNSSADRDLYLIGLSYPTGTLWVSAPGYHCSGSSNGRFVALANLASLAKSAYSSGTWPAEFNSSTPCSHSWGRLGQQVVMVPATPIAVAVCSGGSPSVTRTGTPADLTALVAMLNTLPTQVDSHGGSCGSRGAPQASYSVVFSYAIGPPVIVDVNQGCRPAIENLNLQATDASGVLPLIQRILSR